MRSNLVVFLADLFNLLEINPAQCVRFDRGAAPLIEGKLQEFSSYSHSHLFYFPPLIICTEGHVIRSKGRRFLMGFKSELHSMYTKHILYFTKLFHGLMIAIVERVLKCN